MKIRKLLAVAFTAILLCGAANVNAYAAEVNTAETVTEVESTEESTNEDTEGENKSLKEEKKAAKKEEKKAAKAEKEAAAKAAAEKEAAEKEAAAKAAAEKEAAEKEAAAKAAAEKEAAEKEAAAKAAAEKAAKEAAKPSYTKEELRLLSALIFCEAGSEPYAGKVAVGIVVMNRVESSKFSKTNTVKDVIYAPYQFGPARNGALSKALAAYDAGKFTTSNHKESIEAAKEALEGVKSVTYNGKGIDMKSMLFFSGKVSGAKLTIANHQFK